ncbi:MAG TPA: tRNA lysidine(34) synthetase TilS [Dissulfurispiraceae bacterium]|nr:tRNA lysidine(34) synthetase TilS [Dissulfurispiraceae bacterium]
MIKTLSEKVKETIAKYSMIARGDRVIIGLSGGADSVCLLIVLQKLTDELGIELTAAYIDHGFRPDEVPAEIEFCRKLCTKNNIDFAVRKIDPLSYAESEGLNKQEAARILRYKTLEDVAAETAAAKIALAHNADDQAETMLMHLIRGSGPLGLSGIPPIRSRIIRPLIETERGEIEAFLSQEKADYVTDSSNLKNDYLRNRIRHFIVPAIKNINSEFIGTVLRTTAIFRDEERYFDILVTKTLMKLISRKSDASIELFLAPTEYMDTVLLRRVLRRALAETRSLRGLGLDHVEDLIRLIKSGRSGDRIYLPHSIRAIKSYATLILTSEPPACLNEYVIGSPGEVVLKESSIVLKLSVFETDRGYDEFGDGKKIACLDADKVTFPLTVRPRKPGDYFYPLGFGKRKKIQDYFVDEKIPRDERDSVPLLVTGSNIACIIGCRVDERFKVDDNTTKVLKLEIRPMKF